MGEICVKIPDDVKQDIKAMSEIELSILFTKFVREKISKTEQFRKIVSKSKLTQKKAKLLADDISQSLAERYKTASERHRTNG